jgi:hypothetical protein
MALAHAIENKVEAAYRRGDLFAKRQLLIAEWAKFCARIKRAGNDRASRIEGRLLPAVGIAAGCEGMQPLTVFRLDTDLNPESAALRRQRSQVRIVSGRPIFNDLAGAQRLARRRGSTAEPVCRKPSVHQSCSLLRVGCTHARSRRHGRSGGRGPWGTGCSSGMFVPSRARS